MHREFRYGKKIQELRKERGWTQEHLAAVADLEVRTIQRVEKDQTKSPDTLLDIAGAFDVDLSAIRTTWLIPESRLLRSELVTTHQEFAKLEVSYRTQVFTKSIMTSRQDPRFIETEELWDCVFEDMDCIEPDEPQMWKAYVESIEEPLSRLFGFGLSILTLDEQRDFILPHTADLHPSKPYLDDWKVRHYILVLRHGCYQHIAGQGANGLLHRFDAVCPDGATEMLNGFRRKTGGVHVYANALGAIVGLQGEDSVAWCEKCFPLKNGHHITDEYLSVITGLSLEKLHRIYAEITGEDSLLGLS